MREFIDLQGATGAHYRFRRWHPGHVPVAGNYALIRFGPSGQEVLRLGVSGDLSTLPRALDEELDEQAGVELYTRLNVPRAVRVAEDADLKRHYAPESDETAPTSRSG